MDDDPNDARERNELLADQHDETKTEDPQISELADLKQQLAIKEDENETLNCRLMSMEQQNTELRTKLTVAHGELIKADRKNAK